MELRVENHEVICSLNLLLQLSLLFPEVALLRENPPSTAASGTIQFSITVSTIFWALQFKLEPVRTPAIVWPETAFTKNCLCSLRFTAYCRVGMIINVPLVPELGGVTVHHSIMTQQNE